MDVHFVKITIDTKEESPESIRHVIKLLSNILGEANNNDIFGNQPKSSNLFEDTPKQVAVESRENNSGDLFGNILGNNLAQDKPQANSTTEQQPQQQEVLSIQPDIGQNAVNEEENPEKLKIIEYY